MDVNKKNISFIEDCGNVDISVIIPVFNAEKYLVQCLDSIINQSFKNLEIICINDGSTDKSLNILEEYSKKDKRIKIINISNHGQGYARNIGIKKANGRYISFVDADDFLDLNSYEILHEFIINNKLDALFFQLINYIDTSGNFIETDLYNHVCFKKNNLIFSPEEYEKVLFNIPVCPVSKIYKTDFLRKNNIYFLEDVIFEDNVFFYNVYFNAKKLGFIKKHCYYRRRHECSVTRNFNKKHFDIVKIANRLIDLFIKLGKYDKLKGDIINHTFSMIKEWFLKAPLYLKVDFYLLIKENYKGCNELKEEFHSNLNKANKKIFKIFLDSENYIDFISKFKSINVEYDIIDSIKKNYKVSVIIPTYNTGNILHRTMNSIENQTFGFDNIEVVIVDDCSNNETKDILDKYSSFDNVKVIYLNFNTGSSGTPRNIGVKEASADYVMFLDHDDFFHHNALKELYGKILEYDCDLVFGTYSTVSNGKLFDIYYPNEKSGYFNSISDNERLVAVPPPSIWTKLFKKSVIIENNILFPPILGEDAIFMFKFLLNSKGIYYLKDSLICYHDLNKDSTTNNVSFSYLIEGLTAEKYLFDMFNSMDKDYYFKYRLEENLNFFLSQFSKSSLNEKEVINLLQLLYWFADKGKFYNLSPDGFKNKLLFNSILQKDLYSIMKIKDNELKLIDKNVEFNEINNNINEYVKNNSYNLETSISNVKFEIKGIKKELLYKKFENEKLKYKVNSFRKLFFEYKHLYEDSIENDNLLNENKIKNVLKIFKDN